MLVARGARDRVNDDGRVARSRHVRARRHSTSRCRAIRRRPRSSPRSRRSPTTASFGWSDVCVNETRIGFLAALRAHGRDVVEEDARDSRAANGSPTSSFAPARLRGDDSLPARGAGDGRRAAAARLSRDARRGRDGDHRRRASFASRRAIASPRSSPTCARSAPTPRSCPTACAFAGQTRPLRGRVVTHGDHRLAMAFGILGALRGQRDRDRRSAIASPCRTPILDATWRSADAA